MPDLFSKMQGEQEPDPNPNNLTKGDVVRITHKDRTGFLRRIDGAVGYVESDTNKATGWYSLVALELA